MTATVVTWDERTGRGIARGTWPWGIGLVTILRSEFLSERIRRGRQRAGLKPGDSVSFVAIGAPGRIARRISRSSFADVRPFVTLSPAPPPVIAAHVTVSQSEDEIQEQAFYAGEDDP